MSQMENVILRLVYSLSVELLYEKDMLMGIESALKKDHVHHIQMEKSNG